MNIAGIVAVIVKLGDRKRRPQSSVLVCARKMLLIKKMSHAANNIQLNAVATVCGGRAGASTESFATRESDTRRWCWRAKETFSGGSVFKLVC